MNGVGRLVCIAALALTAQGATYTVGFEKTITIPIPGATAAYIVDPEFAEASADGGFVTLIGKSPGKTHAVVITPAGIQTLEVVIPVPPPVFPKGWVSPRSESGSNETGYFETRYSSMPEQLTNVLDFERQGSDLSTHFHLATTDFFFSPNSILGAGNQGPFALTSLFYSIRTETRKVTLVDQLVEESQLTVYNATVRGLHWQEGNWFFHGGYTSPESFENVFLPVQREGVFGVGYRYRFREHSWLTPSVYYLTMQKNDPSGKPGLIGSLLYTYRPGDGFKLGAELGAGRGIAGAFDLSYKRLGETLKARLRYTPENFPALSVSNFRGLYSDVAWTRIWGRGLSSDLNFTGDKFNLPGFIETSVNGGIQLRYKMSRHWTLSGGGTYSHFQLDSPGQVPLQGFYYPASVSFSALHFGAAFQHQWSSYTGESTGGHQWLASMRAGWGHLAFSGFAERETQAPTLAFVFAQIPGLQAELTELGLTATTPQQITNFLNDNALLINLHYLQNVTVNVTPVREQVSGTLTWRGGGKQPQVDYEFLYDEDQTITNTTQLVIQRIALTQRLGVSNDLSLIGAQYRSKIPGRPAQVTPLYELSMRHHFNSAPAFLALQRHHTIQGRVFEDQDGQGTYTESASGLAGVEMILDQRMRTRTASDGSYKFSGVPEGKHQIVAILPTTKPYYFTTPEQFVIDKETEVYFGVAPSLSSLAGEVTNDMRRGVGGVTVTITGGGHRYTAVSGSGGKLLISRLPEGSYDVFVDPDSLPAGYAIEQPATVQLVMLPNSPGRVALHVRALRNVSGRVLIYDRLRSVYVPVAEAEVILPELSRRIVSDNEGRYIFRDLPSGVFTISVVVKGQPINQIVTVGDEPSRQANIDLIVGQR